MFRCNGVCLYACMVVCVSLPVRVSRRLVEEAARVLGGYLTPREVVEEALRRLASGGVCNESRLARRLDELADSIARVERLLALVDERLERLESMLSQLAGDGVAAAARGHTRHGGDSAQAPGHGGHSGGSDHSEKRQRRRRIADFCGEHRYQVVDLTRISNPQAFIASAKRSGLAVLEPEDYAATPKAILVCPGVTPEELLEAAKHDEELRQALLELGYVYEPEKGRLEWVEEPQL